MNKEKLVACSLAALLLLSGCGAKAPSDTEDTTPSSTATTAAATTEGATTVATTPTEETAPETKITLADGVYSAEFVTDSSMFHANESCDGKGVLTVKDGKAVFHVSLVSKTIQNLYPGLAEDAKNDTENWLQPTEDKVTYSDGFSETVYGFDIPVTVLDEEFDLALIGKKGVWYDHKVSVCNPVRILEDGTYTCEVTLKGGSGKATVESPATLTVLDGKITATVRWSSRNYEYMLVDDVQYDPVQTEGNSTFEIPVVLDTDMAVSANSIAMSQPHLIDYTLHFDSATLTGAAQ